MHVLSDKEIKALLVSDPLIVQDFPDKAGWGTRNFADPLWDDKDSPIQPCSIDLHIGEIFVPGTADGRLGCPDKGWPSYDLEAGHSVVVMSHESLQLPDNVGAIALPPSRISSSGILIANFGHIDPGYKGHLRFTLINMGKEPFLLQQGGMAITLLLFQTGPVSAPFSLRYASSPDRPTRKQVDCLARDFANISERAREIARTEIEGSGLRRTMQTVFIPAVIGTVLGTLFSIIGYWISIKLDVGQDVKKIGVIEERQVDLQRQFTDLKATEEPNKSMAVQIKGLEEQNKRLSDEITRLKNVKR